jgi:dTMP kinase
VTGAVDRWSPLSEALILSAARCDHVERLIRPSLVRGAVVICDRFFDSTRAYQGAAGGVDPNFIYALEQAVVAETRPELTLILDLDPKDGLERAGRRGAGETRFEDKGLSFHHRLREEFLKIAEAEPERCVLIDAADDVDAVERAVWSAVMARTSLLEAT